MRIKWKCRQTIHQTDGHTDEEVNGRQRKRQKGEREEKWNKSERFIVKSASFDCSHVHRLYENQTKKKPTTTTDTRNCAHPLSVSFILFKIPTINIEGCP